EHLARVVPRERTEPERANANAEQLFQCSAQRQVPVVDIRTEGPDDDDRSLRQPRSQMDQQRQAGLVGPMEIVQHVHLGPRTRRATQRLREALEEMAAALLRRQLPRLRQLGEEVPNPWRDLRELGSRVAHRASEVFEARGPGESTLDDLCE